MKLFSALLLVITSVLFSSFAAATTPTYPVFYQMAGVFQYQIATNPVKFNGLSIGNFTTLGLCNTAVSDFNNLLLPGSNTPNPSSAQNTRSVFDGLCFAVLPPQIPGWRVIGFAQVQQAGQSAVPINFDIGSFSDQNTCLTQGLNRMKTLVMSNTPANSANVFYSFTGGCYKLTE